MDQNYFSFAGQKQEAQSHVQKTIQRAKRRKWTLILFGTGLLLILVSFIIYSQLKAKKDQQIASSYSSLENIFDQEQNAFIAKNSSQTNPGHELEEPDHNKSMEGFSDFAKKYPNSPYGWLAAVRSSSYWITQGQVIKAKDILEMAVPHADGHPYISIKMRSNLALIYADEKNFKEALNQIERIEHLPENFFVNQTLFLKAKILYIAGKKQDSLKILSTILEKNPIAGIGIKQTDPAAQILEQVRIWRSYVEAN